MCRLSFVLCYLCLFVLTIFRLGCFASRELRAFPRGRRGGSRRLPRARGEATEAYRGYLRSLATRPREDRAERFRSPGS